MNNLTGNWSRPAAALLLAGCSMLAGGAALGQTSVTVWGWDDNFNGIAMKRAMERYQQEHPDVSVGFTDFGNEPLHQKLQSQLASGSTSGLPDIVLIEDYSAQRFLLSFPDAFEPLGELIDLSGMAPYKLAVSDVDGTSYSLPFDSGVTGLFYRRADLEAGGFTPEDLNDITWDRLIEIGTATEAATGRKLIVQDYGNRTDLVRLMLQSAGTWYITPEGEVTAETDPRFRQVVEEYIEVVRSGIVEDASGWADYLSTFTSGEVSGVAIGAWISSAIRQQPEQSGEWAVAPIPRIDGVDGAVNASNVGGSSWYLLSDGPQKELALDFLTEIWAKDVGFYDQILTEINAIGSLLAASESTAYEQPDQFYGGQTVNADFAGWIPNVPEVNYGIFTAEAEAAFVATIPEVIRGNAELDDALANYTQRLKQQIQ